MATREAKSTGSRPKGREPSVRRRPRVGTTTSLPVKLAHDALDPLDDAALLAWGLSSADVLGAPPKPFRG